jgi:hypothetical protein
MLGREVRISKSIRPVRPRTRSTTGILNVIDHKCYKIRALLDAGERAFQTLRLVIAIRKTLALVTFNEPP